MIDLPRANGYLQSALAVATAHDGKASLVETQWSLALGRKISWRAIMPKKCWRPPIKWGNRS